MASLWSKDGSHLLVSVAVVALEGCASINVAGVFDALRKADNAWRFAVDPSAHPTFKPFFVAMDRNPVRCLDGVIISEHVPASEAGIPDIVVIPGLDDDVERSLKLNTGWAAWIKQWSDSGSCIATSCTGAFIAAESGVLDGKTATTHWAAADLFRHRYPAVTLTHERMIVDSGSVITSGGATTFLNLVLYLAERFGSHERALVAAKLMLIDSDRNSQLPYMTTDKHRTHSDEAVHHAQTVIEVEMSGEVTVTSLANRVGLSSRTLTRRFGAVVGVSPGVYQRRVRMQAARRMLETTSVSVSEIMQAVGYEDAAAFGRIFKRNAGLTPTSYRLKYQSSIGNPSAH